MARDPRMTLQTLAILKVLLSDLSSQHYGLEIAHAAGLPSGTLYPILARLERAGWVTSEWEQLDSTNLSGRGRHPRRYYRISPKGAERAREELRKAAHLLGVDPARPPGLRAPGGSQA
jgi:PadR family transcriptional regulator, regulatory protein PadR